MKKIIALVIGIAFAFGTAGFVTAQTPTPAPKADEKKADDTKKSDKMEKKGDKKGKKGAKKDDSMDKKTEDKK